MIVEITPEFWALLGLIVILYGLGCFVMGYFEGKKRAQRAKQI